MTVLKLPDGRELWLRREEDPESPHEWDNLGTMWKPSWIRYTLRGRGAEPPPTNDLCVKLPLYLMDHGGVSLSTMPFTGPHAVWDSGHVGYIYVTWKKAREELGPDVTEERIRECLTTEVKTYDQYLRGDVWQFNLTRPPCPTCGNPGEIVDSCSGFYGMDPLTNGMLNQLPQDVGDFLRKGDYTRGD